MIDKKTDINVLSLIYPVIVKPIDRSGSRGITKVEKRTKSLRDGLPRLWRSVFFTQKAVDSDTLMMYV